MSRRERLVGPGAIVGMLVLFGGAFAVLSPSGLTRTATQQLEEGAAPDAFDVAWLRARSAAGRVDDVALAEQVVRLARDGRLDEARALLSERPTLTLDAVQRTTLAVALDAAEWRAAGTEGERALAATALRSRLATLASPAGAVDVSLLERASAHALRLDDAELAVLLWGRLVDLEPDRAAEHFAACGRALSIRGEHALAIDCLDRAMTASGDDATRLDIGLERLAISGDDSRAVADRLLALENVGIESRAAFANVALARELPDIAAGIYRDLADVDVPRRDTWLALAARWAEGADDVAGAIEALQAMAPSDDADTMRERADTVDRLMIASGERDAALALAAARIAANPEDGDAVARGVELARSVGEVARALSWNTTWLSRDAADMVAMDRQVDLALANGDPALARGWATRALALQSDAPVRSDATTLVDRHERLAQLAVWTSDPDAALEHRRWLAERRGTSIDLTAVARLAETVRRPALAADTRLALARRTVPTPAELDRMVALFERDGQPDAAAEAIEAVMQAHGVDDARLRSLARLHERHTHVARALAAWQRHIDLFGPSRDALLAEVTLLWRLDRRDDAAATAERLLQHRLDTIDERDAGLLAEIAWRYRQDALLARVQPLLARLSDPDQRSRHARRSIAELEQAGRYRAAFEQAAAVFEQSDDAEFALVALRLAVEHDLADEAVALFDALDGDTRLEAVPAYWSLRASAALRNGAPARAQVAYERALTLDPLDAEAASGLLWLAIGEQDVPLLERLLAQHVPTVEHLPALWPAIALAHVAIGDAAASLPWFERAVGQMKSDYGLLLGWADALDEAGELDRARRVRRFAVADLRPRLSDGVVGSEDTLLRQYGGLLARYGRADDNEAWMHYVLSTDLDADDTARIWREDMAIAWLMATERHEHARLVMARRHAARLETPRWQDMALALRIEDRDAIETMLDAGTGLSAGSRMLALRTAGRDADAFALALRTLANPATRDDRTVARAQYVALRRQRPSHATVVHDEISSGDLAIGESGFALRHAPGVGGIGYALDVMTQRFDSERYDTRDADERTRVELGLFERDAGGGFGVTAGLENDVAGELAYGRAWWATRSRNGRRELTLSGAWNEPADESAELRLAGSRTRLALDADFAAGQNGFVRLGTEVAQLASRIDEQRLARGVTTRAEIGLRGAAGTLDWSTSLAAEDVRRDREDRLPDAFALSPRSSLDRVLAERRTSLTLNGALSSGAPGSDFPDGRAPRWRIATGVGHVWPERSVGLQLGAGAGVRVLGNDELGVRLRQDMRLSGSRAEPDETRIGLDYRHQF